MIVGSRAGCGRVGLKGFEEVGKRCRWSVKDDQCDEKLTYLESCFVFVGVTSEENEPATKMASETAFVSALYCGLLWVLGHQFSAFLGHLIQWTLGPYWA